MTERAPAVVVEDVEKTYVDERTFSRVTAIKRLNLTVHRGEFLCIVGPSGCGKTTLLDMVAGLKSITAGQILVAGRRVKRPGADRGMVFQDYALLPWKTVRDNVEFGLRMKGVPREERARTSRYYLDAVGLGEFADKYPKDLSGGMKQRVAVVRALANRPEVLLMDEPFASVDAITRMQLQEEITRMWTTEKTTVMFVTHSVDEAVFLGDRVAVFSRRPGRIQEVFEVDLARPRRWADMESNGAFQALRAQVLASVQRDAGVRAASA
jgi:NitT/TauT family transport system ATP-binding protein